MKKLLFAIIVSIFLFGGSYLYFSRTTTIKDSPNPESAFIIDDFTARRNIEVVVDRTGNEKVDKLIEQFVEPIVDEFRRISDESEQTLSTPYDLIIKSHVYSFSEAINSIQLNIYEYTGGAHSNEYYKTYTYDKTSGEIYDFKDLFQEEHNPLNTIFPLIKEDLSFLDDQDWLEEGTGEEPDDFKSYQNFVLTEDEIIFTFPAYQIAPYSEGPQEVRIPLADINVVLKPPFLNLSAQ